MLKRNRTVVLALILVSAPALAEEPGLAIHGGAEPELAQLPSRTLHLRPIETAAPDESDADELLSKSARAASDGFLSPFTSPAAIAKLKATASTVVGYDTAAAAPRARATADAKITNFLALRVEFDHGPATGSEDRLSVGARFALLEQRRYGVDLGVGLFYQPKDFRGEGNAVAGLLVARHFDRLGLFANALFGTDGEGDDQSAELRLGTLYRANTWLSVGVDGRSRLNLSQDSKRWNARNIDWELQAAPTAIFCLGQFSVMALFGPSFLKESLPPGELNRGGTTHSGLLAMAGAGSAF